MLDALTNFLDKTVSDFSKQRMLMIVLILFIIILGVASYEYMTASFQLSKYNDSVTILNSIEKLDNSNLKSQKIISNIYEGLSRITNPESLAFKRNILITREVKQAFWSILPWSLIILIGLPTAFSKEGSISAFFVVSFIAFIMGIIGYWLPTTWNIWIVSGLISQILNIIVFVLFAKLDKKLAKNNY